MTTNLLWRSSALLRGTAQRRPALPGRHVSHDDGHLNLLVHRLPASIGPVRATLPDAGRGRAQVARMRPSVSRTIPPTWSISIRKPSWP